MIIKGVDKKFCRISNGVLEKFNSLANQTPNKPLIFYDEVGYTFEEIRKKSEYVSEILKKEKIKSGTGIIIDAVRGPLYISIILGILSQSCVFIPVPKNETNERRKDIIKNTGAKLYIEIDQERDTIT